MNQTKTQKNAAYFQSLMEDTGCTSYKFSDTPLEFDQEEFNLLNNAVEGMLNEIDTSEYFGHCMRQNNWSLPTVPMKETDYHGCADFLLTPNGAKLIEMNINFPGKVGLMQFLGEMSKLHLGDPEGNWTNLDFNDCLKLEIEKALPGAEKIAILVSHFDSSQEHMLHYRYFSDQLNKTGLNTTVILANEIVIEEAGFRWNDQFFDGAINLVIPFVWEDNQDEFQTLTKLLKQFPERIFPSPTGGMLGTKDLLSYLSSKRDKESAKDWRNNVLHAQQLSEFNSVDELIKTLKPEQIVLKPFKDYGGAGVHVQPSLALIEDVFSTKKSEYMVQEFTESLSQTIHTESDEVLDCHSIIYRVFFASKKAFGYQGYYLTGELNGAYHSAPIKVTS